jgi:hypothetical protein
MPPLQMIILFAVCAILQGVLAIQYIRTRRRAYLYSAALCFVVAASISLIDTFGGFAKQ